MVVEMWLRGLLGGWRVQTAVLFVVAAADHGGEKRAGVEEGGRGRLRHFLDGCGLD